MIGFINYRAGQDFFYIHISHQLCCSLSFFVLTSLISYFQTGGHFSAEPMAGSSSQPILVDNVLAQANLADNQVIIPPEDSRKRRSSKVTLSDDKGKPVAKRKIDFDDFVQHNDNSVAMPNFPPSTVTNENLVQAYTGIEHLEDDDHIGLINYCLVGVEGNPEPLPFVGPHIDAAGSAGDYSQSPYNLTQILPPAADPSDVNAYLNCSFF
jgi:hypothetical protein